jgi:prepilin-type N-terminal cleavage/methylation domain-containing protein
MRQAFSLVELSIVLVILGLLTGGILGGQSLIRAAELRSVSNDYQRYKTAIYTFRDKYFQLPGDMTNATAFWTSAGGTGADTTCADVASTTAATCNGDGDGRIEARAGSTVDETYRAWQHLANAGLIEGTYSGTRGASGNWHSVIGTNVPRSRIGTTGYSLADSNTFSGNAQFFDGAYTTRMFWGTASGADSTVGPAISSEEAWNIDTKLDDGKPSTGSVLSYKNGYTVTPNCSTTAVVSTAAYTLGTSGTICALIFQMGI